MTEQEIETGIASRVWYHPIKIGKFTAKPKYEFPDSWSIINDGMSHIDFKDKEVLDVGCRDGMWAFMAEERGASDVFGFDNDLRSGNTQWAKHALGSKARFSEHNLLDPAFRPEGFDVVLFFGVLYHLRYPFDGIRKVTDAAKLGGVIAVETGIWERNEDYPLLMCPTGAGPYEETSCSFFNLKGLVDTMATFGCEVEYTKSAENVWSDIRRYLVIFRKKSKMSDLLNNYWHGRHTMHAEA